VSGPPGGARASPFERSGLARLSDVGAPDHQAIFVELESSQEKFFTSSRNLPGGGYAGHRDPLHCWSRAWEYPYVFWHLRRMRRRSEKNDRNLRVADVGSGSTFFPFAVAKLGYDVICVDVHRGCLDELERATALIDCGTGTISTQHADGSTLPLADSYVDVAYCISVLEHIQQFDRIIREIARVLVPGGACILTVDLALRGPQEMSVRSFERLSAILAELFVFEFADGTVHPADLLTSAKGPYPLDAYRGWRWGWYWAKQTVLKPIIGKPATPPTELAVYGAVLRKR
jgi:SAM-dependent methyltransferase